MKLEHYRKYKTVVLQIESIPYNVVSLQKSYNFRIRLLLSLLYPTPFQRPSRTGFRYLPKDLTPPLNAPFKSPPHTDVFLDVRGRPVSCCLWSIPRLSYFWDGSTWILSTVLEPKGVRPRRHPHLYGLTTRICLHGPAWPPYTGRGTTSLSYTHQRLIVSNRTFLLLRDIISFKRSLFWLSYIDVYILP